MASRSSTQPRHDPEDQSKTPNLVLTDKGKELRIKVWTTRHGYKSGTASGQSMASIGRGCRPRSLGWRL